MTVAAESAMDESDSVAVARVKSGDADAYRVLVDRHSRSVFRLAYRMTGNEQDSEDVVQETFLRAYKQLHRYEARSSFSTWLYRIAANYSLDLVRRRKRHGEVALSDPEGEHTENLDAVLPSPSPGPDRLMFSGKVQECVSSTLNELSRQERTAFVLRHFEGQSIEEIAGALGLSGNAAKHSIFRAVQKLRRALDPLVNTGTQA
jgi:RNA polymerase sigma-70 factor, ECF subfamily